MGLKKFDIMINLIKKRNTLLKNKNIFKFFLYNYFILFFLLMSFVIFRQDRIIIYYIIIIYIIIIPYI